MPSQLTTCRRNLMPKWDNHKIAVRETLRRQKKSIYWLHAQLPTGTSRSLIYEYVRGKGGISVENMQRINKILGLRYTDE